MVKHEGTITLLVYFAIGNLHDGILHEEVELRKIWDDHGTHAVSDFSCWNPILPNEEFVLLSSIPMGS